MHGLTDDLARSYSMNFGSYRYLLYFTPLKSKTGLGIINVPFVIVAFFMSPRNLFNFLLLIGQPCLSGGFPKENKHKKNKA